MKTYASFYDIVEGVKEETGITNLVNRYNEINRLIVRAERDINPYAGHFIVKTIRYKKGTVNFNGKHIRIPADLIEVLAVYDKSEHGRTKLEIRNHENSHILLCNDRINDTAVLRYWATQNDPEGHPYVPYTHYESVIKLIVWKFYSQRFYQNDGNLNAKLVFQDDYERSVRAARGFDIFPTEENLENMRMLNKIPGYYEIICDDCFCSCSVSDDNSPIEDVRQVWFWQENSLSQQIFEDDVDDEFLEDKVKISYSSFQTGAYFTSAFIGRYGLAIQGGPETPDTIIDALGSSIADSVTFKYYPERKLLVLISKNYITPGTFFLKLT